MNLRIAIDLAGRGEQKTRACPLAQGEQIARPDHVGEHRVLGIGLVMRRRGGAGEIEHPVHPPHAARQQRRQRIDHIRFNQGEARLAAKLAHIGEAAGAEIIDADDVGAIRKQGFAKVRSEKAGAAGHDTSFSCFSHAVRLSSGAADSGSVSRRSRVQPAENRRKT